MTRDVYYVMGRIFARLLKLNPNLTYSIYTDAVRHQMLKEFAKLHALMIKAGKINAYTQEYLIHYLDLIDIDDVPNETIKSDDYDRFIFSFIQEYHNLNDSDIIQRSGLQQQEIAEICGVSRQTIARWEKGRIPIDAFLKIEDAIAEKEK